ncbi:hypothetical protein [Candidatus Poriferisocius sp.]|uniref:hypothetical protein n=1 Tax=Candidatus Poriferisocius sp. TaxID=3101276 RepID=UPI003B52A9BB
MDCITIANAVVFVPYSGLWALDFDMPVGNCAMPDSPPVWANTPGAAPYSLASSYEPCTIPALTFSGSAVTKCRMLVGSNETISAKHYGGYSRHFSWPTDFHLVQPPWWPKNNGDFWYQV